MTPDLIRGERSSAIALIVDSSLDRREVSAVSWTAPGRLGSVSPPADRYGKLWVQIALNACSNAVDLTAPGPWPAASTISFIDRIPTSLP